MTISTPTFEDFQKFSKEQLDAFTSASTTLSKGLQDIAAESSDYSKKAFAAGTAMYEKLLGARSVEWWFRFRPSLPRRPTRASSLRRRKFPSSTPGSLPTL